MNKLKISIFFFMFFSEIVLYGGDFTIVVKDQNGSPVEGANITVGFDELPLGNFSNRKGITDVGGKFQFSGGLYNVGFLAVRKTNYYDTGIRFSAAYHDENEGKTKLFDEKTVEVELKEISDPVSMYWLRFYKKQISIFDQNIGFDLKTGDWVKPFGKGTEANCYFRLENLSDDPKIVNRKVSIHFPNKGDGLIPFEIIPFEGEYGGSELQSDYLAPESGYQQDWEWLDHYDWTGSRGGKRVHLDYSRSRAYYFRVNTILNEAGNVISAYYGKIYGDLRLRFVRETGEITWGGIYFNPQINDRRVEFDRTRPLPDSLLDEERKRRARHVRKGIKVDEGPLMLKHVRP